MEFTEISDTGVKASRICLGTWASGGWMWGGTEEEQSIAAIQEALDRGITIIDTAVYGFGRSEKIVEKHLRDVVSEVDFRLDVLKEDATRYLFRHVI